MANIETSLQHQQLEITQPNQPKRILTAELNLKLQHLLDRIGEKQNLPPKFGGIAQLLSRRAEEHQLPIELDDELVNEITQGNQPLYDEAIPSEESQL